jgi:hypothetical protein
VSRDRDCYSLTKISEFLGGRQRFGMRQKFDHFECGTREGAPFSLGVYIYAIQHINKEENEAISGAWEKSAAADSAEPNSFDR